MECLRCNNCSYIADAALFEPKSGKGQVHCPECGSTDLSQAPASEWAEPKGEEDDERR